jgi:Mn-dependent DtxR family transcriptional regulator
MTAAAAPLIALSTDSLCALFKLAVLPPDTVIKYTQVETLLCVTRLEILPAMQPLIDRGWVEGFASRGYTLTPDGVRAVQALLLLATHTL